MQRMPLNFFLFVLLTLFSNSLLAMTTLDGKPAHIDNYKDNKHWLIVQAWLFNLQPSGPTSWHASR